MGLGSGIRKKPIPDPGSRGQKGTGSRVRIRNTVFNRLYRLEIHSLMVGFFDPACELLLALMDEGTILVYCCPSTFSLTSPPPPPLS
jgi:hypothetical protein